MIQATRREIREYLQHIIKGMTQRARRSFITKSLREDAAHLEMLKAHEAAGHEWYLGDSTLLHVLQAERYLEELKRLKQLHY